MVFVLEAFRWSAPVWFSGAGGAVRGAGDPVPSWRRGFASSDWDNKATDNCDEQMADACALSVR